jgi:glucose-6-phosphate 1-epimerase
MPAADLNQKFAIANALKFEDTPGGLVRAVISTSAGEGDLYLQGAHVAHWTPKGQQRPVLFTSSRSLFAPGKAIRGGVPIIWPWFGGRGGGLPGPAHGFARSMEWSVEGTDSKPDGSVGITLALTPNDATRALGYDSFALRFRAVLGATLEMELEARNNGSEALKYEEALHTYFAIGDVNQVSVSGLEGVTYIDKTDGFQRKQQPGKPVTIAKETDSVYVSTTGACTVHDPVWNRRIVVAKSGSSSTVVWNPWVEKTKGMSDMAPDDWKEMICVESANASDNAVALAPGAAHVLQVSISVE